MTRPLAAFAVAVGLVAAVAAWAETPKFSSISPFGASRRGNGGHRLRLEPRGEGPPDRAFLGRGHADQR